MTGEAGHRDLSHPEVSRPMILVPAIVAWHIGMTSCNSASNTLAHNDIPSESALAAVDVVGTNVPVEVLGSANSHDGVRVGQPCEDAYPGPSVNLGAFESCPLHACRRTRWSSQTVHAQP